MARYGRLLLWPTGLVLGLVAEQALFGWEDPRGWVPDLAVGWVLIACGLIGWSRLPESRFGALTAATGFSWFLGNFAGVESAAIVSIANHAIFLYRGPLVHMVIGYPTGQASSRIDRAAVVMGYAAACVPAVWTSELATIGLTSLLVATNAHGYARASGRARRARLQALRAASALGLVLAGQAVARLAFPSAETDELTGLALQAVICAIAVVLLAGLLATSRERAAVTDLVVELGGRRSTNLRAELARSLGDPTLAVGYWLPSAGAFVDAAGVLIELPTGDPTRAVTLIGGEQDPIAALVHDPAVLEDALLLKAATVATQLTAKNARLQDEVRMQVTELERSRRRILEAGDAEREDLEQRLHDGAEQVLGELAEHLRRGRVMARGRATEGRIERAEAQLAGTREELRQLAAGLYPRALSERGLEGALRWLAERSPVPVAVTVADGALPPQLEAAAYFMCSEVLANVAKYACASSAAISIGESGGNVEVAISDDGNGGADPSLGTGLRGLADRVDALGGVLRIESRVGEGTRVTAEFPYPQD